MGFSVETIALLFLIFGILNFDLFGSSARQASAWECNHMDTALIRIQPFNLNIEKKASSIRILYRNEACEKCNFVDSFSVSLNNTTGRQFEIDSYYTYDFVAEAEFGDSDEKKLLCQLKQSSFAECGEYEFDLSHCKIDKTSASDTRTFWSRNPLVLGMLVIAAFVLSTSYIEAQSNKNKKKEQPGVTSSRLQSLDAFRGFSLFLMIFVNYGSGGYKFLQHAPWHGITLADFVFPWFLWIMGFSVPLSTNTLLGRADAKKSALFVKVAARSLKMFCIGLMLNSKNGVELANLRYFGVFQRIALCYFFVATLEIVLHRNIDRTRALTFLSDLVWSKFHFLVVFSLAAVWHWLVFNMAVPGCPVGYLGPGGLHDNSSYSDCTGGATGYIDKILFGESHLYKWATPKKLYRTNEPFDPEGFLGTLNAIVIAYLGVQAGRALVFHKQNKSLHLMLWISWAFLSFVGYAITSLWIPVNKNLWTTSYTLLTSSSAFLLQAFFYYTVDVKGWWSGSPFSYLGKNSLLIYICHVLFSKMLPVYFVVAHTHLSQMLMNLWGSIVWTLFAIYLYSINTFLNL